MKHILLSITFVLFTITSLHAQTQGAGVADMDGNTYQTEVIGNGDSWGEDRQYVMDGNELFNGSGTPEDPYQIETIHQLQSIYPEYLDKHFIQTKDIDASVTEHWNDGDGFYPIGDELLAFTGTYNGNGFKILNLHIDRDYRHDVGMFGRSAGTLQSIYLDNIYVNGGRFTGGLVAHNVGTISKSIVKGNLHANNEFFGGLVGYNGGYIQNSYFEGSVNGRGWVGGLVGVHSWGVIENSYSIGSVSGIWGEAGGLVGIVNGSGTIINSFSHSSVNANDVVGGLVGTASQSAQIASSFATGIVIGNTDTGGLVGSNGIQINDSFWNTETSGMSNGIGRGLSGDVTGLTTSQMTGVSAYYNMEALDFEETWHLTESYPALQWQDDVLALPLPPRKVELFEPADDSTGLTRVPKLAWNADDRAETYRIQIAADPDFESPLLDESTSETQWALTDSLDFESTLHWRVRAVNESAEGDWSDAWSFTTVVEPGMVALEAPADSATYVSAIPSFSWAAVDGVEHYDFQLASDPDFTSLTAYFYDLEDTTVQITDTLDPLVTYFWRVRSGNIGGKSEWSQAWSFTTVDLPAAPALLSPADSSLHLDPPVAFVWAEADRAEEYRIRIYANEMAPESLVVDSLLTDTTFTYGNLSHTNTYLWTVAGHNSAGEGPPSPSTLLTMRILAPVLSTPGTDEQDVIRYPELVWEPVDNATGYLVELAQDSLFEESTAWYEIADSNAFVAGPLQWRTVYYWRAYTVGESDTSLASPVSSFLVGGPVITFEPDQLDFGTVRPGSKAELALTIENTGGDTLFIDAIQLPDDRLSIILPDSIQTGSPSGEPSGDETANQPYGLPIQKAFQAIIEVDGSDPGHIDGHLVISDGLGTVDSLHISAFIGIGELSMSTDTLYFPSRRIGDTHREPVTLSNTGNDTLRIQSVTVSSGAFSTKQRSFTLEPGQSVVDSVTFAPSMTHPSTGYVIYRDAENKRDTLRVFGNAHPIVAELEDVNPEPIGRNLHTTVGLSAAGSMDPDGDELTFEWRLIRHSNGSTDNGSGGNILSTDRDFEFQAPVGTHTIQLKVTDTHEASDSTLFRVHVVSHVKQMQAAVEAGLTAYGDSVGYRLFVADVNYTPGTGSTIIEVDRNLDRLFTLTVPQIIRTAASVSADSSVFITNGPNLSAFDKRGVELWSTKGLGALATVTPTIDAQQQRIYVGVSNQNLFAYDYVTGQNVWTYRVDAPISASAVITRDRKLIFPTQAGTLYGFDLTRQSLIDGSNNVAPTWQQSFPDSVVHAPAIDGDDNIVVGTLDGNLLKLSLGPGGNVSILWEESVCQRISTSPVIDGEGFVYVGCQDGVLHKVDPVSGSSVWTYATDGPITSTPAISDYGRIYFGNESGELIALDLEGRKQWRFEGQGAIRADILHIAGVTYIGTMDGNVFGLYDEGGRTGLVASKSIADDGKPLKPVWGTYMGNHRRTGWAADVDAAVETSAGTEDIPDAFFLSQNYPNPFNPVTVIEYNLPEQVRVRLEVFNMLGQRVKVLVDEQQAPGSYQVRFDATEFSSGIYIYRIHAGEYIRTRQMTLIK